MKVIRNAIWFFPIGFFLTFFCLMLGVMWCITIVGIPFGKRYFELSQVAICPFDYVVRTDFSSNKPANIVWLIFGGLRVAIFFGMLGTLLHMTIIGIPFGKECYKLASFSFAPFGVVTENTRDVVTCEKTFLAKERIKL